MTKAPDRLPSPIPPAASIRMLRDAVTKLSERGSVEVQAVRDAFITGTPPVQTAGSGSKADFINRFGGSGVAGDITKSTAQFGLATAPIVATVAAPKPELDFIEVGVDASFGVLDSFYTRVVFSIPTDQLGRVSSFRVLRARNGKAQAAKPSFSAMVDSQPVSNRSKSAEGASNAAFRADSVGVGNKLTDFIADDYFSRQRVVVGSSSLRPLPPTANTNRRGTQNGLLSIANGDRSVLENVTFAINQRTLTPAGQVKLPLEVGQRSGVNVLQGSTVGAPSSIVSAANSLGFYEIARLPAVPTRKVGLYSEIECFDPAVVYGASYSYCVVAVARTGFSGPRTRLGTVDILRSVTPATPQVLYGVSGGSPRFSIRSSGSFADHVEVFRRGGNMPSSVVVLNSRRRMIDEGTAVPLDSGFYHIGDIGIGIDRSSVFVDRGISPGQELDYRFYSVDSFGLKSATPFSCSIMLPDVGHTVPLSLPTITAEQGPGGRVLNVLMSSDDPRVTSFVLRRRDLSLHENSYREPTQPDYFMFGSTTVKRARSRIGPVLNQNSSAAWNGIFRSVSGSAAFVDRTVEFDRSYQYSAYGVDARGNRTSTVPSSPIFVAIKPVLDPPTALTGTVLSSDGTPTSILISWTAGAIDFSPNELIGDQDVLFATSQRSVFQAERREVGQSVWQAMPAVTGNYFIDRITTEQAPKFRPSFAVANAEYDYRLIAMQSGAFISTHTDPIRVAVRPEITPPPMIWVRTTSTMVRPMKLVVSWQYEGTFVDTWQVERAATNKLFGSKILSMDSREARGLSYSQLACVTRESSRGHGLSASNVGLDPRVFRGNRFFVDCDISMANSYFYRVRALDSSGHASDWSYGGITLSDSPFDRKFLSSLSDEEKAALSLDPRPLARWERQ